MMNRKVNGSKQLDEDITEIAYIHIHALEVQVSRWVGRYKYILQKLL